MMRNTILLLLTLSSICITSSLTAQVFDGSYMDVLTDRIESYEDSVMQLRDKVDDIKMEQICIVVKESGLPSEDYVQHGAMFISFNAKAHQASWVGHMISTDIIDGIVSRTNDFRDDPLIEGDAIEGDYFLKELQPDSTYIYDGFGYDRGHLAPSADFRWSRKALSESYFYSNMSPQLPDFNREDWAELEATLRAYVMIYEVPLIVYTLPLISDGDPVIERGVNKMPIPGQFLKVAYDPENKRGIAFLMENHKIESDLADFAISIDRAEEVSGFDFYQTIDDESIEANFDIALWFPESASTGVMPLYAPTLPGGHINTTQAKRMMGSNKKIKVCGTVVSTRFSGSGNYWINLDKKFPNTVFSAYIRKADFKDFDSIHTDYLLKEKVCFYGKVGEMFSQPNMVLTKQEEVSIYE